ncbi:MAG: RNA methyltransferase [Clostridia bacterium]|nr:RNA methyltransferase [Clostridia bacterium]
MQFLSFSNMQSNDRNGLLTSRSNALVKQTAAVRKSARERRESGLFFLEGARLCADAASSGTVVSVCLYTDDAARKYADRLQGVLAAAEKAARITPELAAYLSETQSPQGVFCLCRMREHKERIDPAGKYLALSDLQNPDNLGAISRTAEALGLSGLIVEGGCDVYNPKAQRASMGSLLRIPIVETTDLYALLEDCRRMGMHVYASTPDTDALPVTRVSFSAGTVCVVGNEGAGVRPEILRSCARVTIPMCGRAESFNAAAAATILLWEMTREDVQ